MQLQKVTCNHYKELSDEEKKCDKGIPKKLVLECVWRMQTKTKRIWKRIEIQKKKYQIMFEEERQRLHEKIDKRLQQSLIQ